MTNSTVVKLLLLMLLGLALTTSLVRAELPNDFAAVDLSGFLSDVRVAAQKDGAPAAEKARVFYRRHDRDCVSFTFSGSETRSERVRLRSQEWVEDCYWVPGDPRNGGGRRECHTRPGMSYSEMVSVTLQEIKPRYPWESDRFQVCLEGPWLDVRAWEASYEYRWVSSRRDGDIVLAPERKIPMSPDRNGIAADSWTAAMVLTLRDKWASHYAGEQTALKLTLKRHVRNWPDYDIVTVEQTLPAAETYTVDFKRFADQFTEELRAGKDYYVEISFARKGSVSTDDEVSADKTGDASYQPPPAS